MLFRLKTHHMFLVLGLIAPLPAFAGNFCIKVGAGFGSGGTSYIAPSFDVPAPGICKPWSGFTKTASTVIATATGTGCLSTSGKVLTFSILDTDPSFFGANMAVTDQVRICAKGATDCTITGKDLGNFAGRAKQQTCTSALLKLPDSHD